MKKQHAELGRAAGGTCSSRRPAPGGADRAGADPHSPAGRSEHWGPARPASARPASGCRHLRKPWRHPARCRSPRVSAPSPSHARAVAAQPSASSSGRPVGRRPGSARAAGQTTAATRGRAAQTPGGPTRPGHCKGAGAEGLRLLAPQGPRSLRCYPARLGSSGAWGGAHGEEGPTPPAPVSCGSQGNPPTRRRCPRPWRWRGKKHPRHATSWQRAQGGTQGLALPTAHGTPEGCGSFQTPPLPGLRERRGATRGAPEVMQPQARGQVSQV